MSAPAVALTRKGRAQPVRGQAGFDIIIECRQRDTDRREQLNPSQWRQPFTRVPITVQRDGFTHTIGEGTPLIDRKGNLRIRGIWSSTPTGEYVRTLVATRALRTATASYVDTIDDDGMLVREVTGGAFTLPTDPPPVLEDRPDAGGGQHAATLLGLVARVYTAPPTERAGLADLIIACAVELGGRSTEGLGQ